MDEGWYPDPDRGGAERWWDGLGWTEFRREAPTAVSRRVAQREPIAHRLGDSTRALAFVVGSPVWVGVLYWFVSLLSVPLLLRMPIWERPTIKLGFLAVMLLVLTAAAVVDARTLRARGFAWVPNPLWALATPIVYLELRSRVEGADRVPLGIHLGLLVVSVLGVLLGISVGIVQLAL